MIRTITTRGTDVHVIPRDNGGWAVQQGRSHILLTAEEAGELAQALIAAVAQPDRARIMRYPRTGR